MHTRRRGWTATAVACAVMAAAGLAHGEEGDPRPTWIEAARVATSERDALDAPERALAAAAGAAQNDVRNALEVHRVWERHRRAEEPLPADLRVLPDPGAGAAVVGAPALRPRESIDAVDRLTAEAETLRDGRSSFGPLNAPNRAVVEARLEALARVRRWLVERADARIRGDLLVDDVLAQWLAPGDGYAVLESRAKAARDRFARAREPWAKAVEAHAKQDAALADLRRREETLRRARTLEDVARAEQSAAPGSGTLAVVLLHTVDEDSDAFLGAAPGKRIYVRVRENYGLRSGTVQEMASLVASVTARQTLAWTPGPHPVSRAPHRHRARIEVLVHRTGLTPDEVAALRARLATAMNGVMGPTAVPPMNCPGPVHELYYPLSLPAEWLR